MKKWILMLSLVLVVCLTVGVVGYAEGGYDFRNTRWGMTKEEVMKNETAKLKNKYTEDLYYETIVDGKKCSLSYGFAKNRLVNGMYMFHVFHSNPEGYLVDYEGLKELLIKKYGKNKGADELWLREYKSMSKASAFASGDLSFGASWETNTTYISLFMAATGPDRLEIGLTLTYKCKQIPRDPKTNIEELKNL